MSKKPIEYTVHAFQRMTERRIAEADVEQIIRSGEIIREYPDDRPQPSRLLFGWIDKRPLHVVVAENEESVLVVTAYEPDPNVWNTDFKSKKKGED